MMTKDQIRSLLASILETESAKLDQPTESDWAALERRFDTRFPPEFKSFIELMSEFSFPGDIYNVASSGKTNGNDSITTVYNNERQRYSFPENLVPFYGIGNGDYFALDSKEREVSRVHFWDHASEEAKPYCGSFEDWLKRLPKFLNGED